MISKKNLIKRRIKEVEDISERIKELEKRIDQKLMDKNYCPGIKITVLEGERWPPGFFLALKQKYEKRGWKAEIREDGSNIFLDLQ